MSNTPEVRYAPFRTYKDEAKLLCLKGRSPKQIMKAIPGASPFQIARIRKMIGLPKANARVDGTKYETTIRSLKARGLTYAQIGKKLGRTRQAIQHYIKIKGVPKKGKCSRCNKVKCRLHGHHVSYETNNHYEIVCVSCHAKETKQNGATR